MEEDRGRASGAEPGPRNETESTSPTGNPQPTAEDDDVLSPLRDRRYTAGEAEIPTAEDNLGNEGLRRRGTGPFRGRGIPSLAPRTTLAQRTQGNFTLAGPDDTANLRRSQEPFVQPGYAELNPAYEQPSNAKPVWSLAKPLPRVVRPGMVPTKDELLQNRVKPQLPAENSQKMGLEVDPNDLEQGRIEKKANPQEMAAQVEDARVQRENNFMSKILNGEAASRRTSLRLSRTSSHRERRPSAWAPAGHHLSTVYEGEQQDGNYPQASSEEPLRPGSQELPAHSGEETDEPVAFPALQESTLPEDLHPLVQDLVEDEIHNNHTIWSVIRTHHREALAEALGVYVQLTIGFCADLSVTLAAAGDPNSTAWAWGLATMMAIYVSGGVSGAHLNPAITIMLWFFRGFPKNKMPEYFAAQFIAAFCAGLTAYGLYYDSIREYLLTNTDVGIVNSFVTNQRQVWIGPATAFFNEFLGTVILVINILALGDDQNAPPGAGMNSLIIGLIITCLCITFGYSTGAAFNPSRDFGPRLALLALGYSNDLFLDPYWFYGPWAGAVSGALIGAFLYDFFIFTGGESPVNYPLERTQRAMRLKRMKLMNKLHLRKREAENVIH